MPKKTIFSCLATMEISTNNKRIAKNTGLLYIRMLFSMAISLYTSRVILDVLGVSDYGVYCVVGGVVSMFTFLNASMAGATSRFITYELGTGNVSRLKKIFSSTMLVHLIIALLIVIVAETFGLWFLNNKLVIASESMEAAQWVYQLSILTAVVSLTQVPYNASIMANERMSVFAFIDMSVTVLKLVIVYLLLVLPGNKLIVYAILTAVVGFISAMAYRIYCVRNFSYCHISFKAIDKGILKSALAFSGWDLYGNLSVMGRTQGVSMLANMFFGTIANAAMGVAAQVQTAINSFATNVIAAIKPQIIKSYAAKDYNYMSQLLFSGSKFAFLSSFVLALPMLIETPFVLGVWLKVVPEYAVWICRWTLCFCMLANVSVVLVTGVHATGNIKGASIINGTMYLLVVPITYFAYKNGWSVYFPFVLNALFVFIGALANFLYTKRYVRSLSFRRFLSQVIMRCVLVAVLAATMPVVLERLLSGGWLRFGCVCVVSVITTMALSYFVALNNSERQFAIKLVQKLFKR